jgi:hypothetical protein
MGEYVDRKKATDGFHQFVTGHLASQGRHVEFTAPDLPAVEPIEVDRADALKTFFEVNPQHLKYRGEVEKVFSDQQQFSFSKERWNETAEKLRTAKPR